MGNYDDVKHFYDICKICELIISPESFAEQNSEGDWVHSRCAIMKEEADS